MKISVIICTHNPRRDYFQRILTALGSQTLDAVHWELLVVDNLSDPPIEESFIRSLVPNSRVIREENQGVVWARLRGFRETETDLIVSIDDDNLPSPDYLSSALTMALEMPYIGVWSANITGEFEVPPKAWMKPYLKFLALSDVKRDRWSNHAGGDTLPMGAGMVLRRCVAEEFVRQIKSDPRRLGLGRKGESLMGGEDTDIGYACVDLGLGCAYMTRLQVTHLIPKERLDSGYLQRLVQNTAASHRWLERIHGGAPMSLTQFLRFNILAAIGEITGVRNPSRFIAAISRGMLRGEQMDV
jgi:glycosyltransferase involved in cell wall biosynthesis